MSFFLSFLYRPEGAKSATSFSGKRLGHVLNAPGYFLTRANHNAGGVYWHSYGNENTGSITAYYVIAGIKILVNYPRFEIGLSIGSIECQVLQEEDNATQKASAKHYTMTAMPRAHF